MEKYSQWAMILMGNAAKQTLIGTLALLILKSV